jgi:hypothetical protein
MLRPKRPLVAQLSVSDLEAAFQERVERWPKRSGADAGALAGPASGSRSNSRQADPVNGGPSPACPRVTPAPPNWNFGLVADPAVATFTTDVSRTDAIPALPAPPPLFAPARDRSLHDDGPASWSNRPSPAVPTSQAGLVADPSVSRVALRVQMDDTGAADRMEASLPLLRDGSTELPSNSYSPSRGLPRYSAARGADLPDGSHDESLDGEAPAVE